MSDRKSMLEQIKHLDNYSLLLVFEAAQKVISQRGLSKGLIRKPSTLKKVQGAPKIKRPAKCGPVSQEFEDILNQDWNYLFTSSYDIEPRYYVYIHSDPREEGVIPFKPFSGLGQPFYVGKGTGDRYTSKTRNKPHRDLIDQIIGYGFPMNEIAHIYKDNMAEKEALILESKLITYFGCRNEIGVLRKRYINGLRKGLLVNTDTGVRPKEFSNYIQSLRRK